MNSLKENTTYPNRLVNKIPKMKMRKAMRKAREANFGIIFAIASTIPLKISIFPMILRIRNPIERNNEIMKEKYFIRNKI